MKKEEKNPSQFQHAAQMVRLEVDEVLLNRCSDVFDVINFFNYVNKYNHNEDHGDI